MKCIFCKEEDTNVVDSRLMENNVIKRRRECKKCEKRFNTTESAVFQDIIVIKKDGSSAIFNRNKIYNGIVRSLEKRNYNQEDLVKLIDNIEDTIRQNYKKEIKSSEIGDIILQNLLEFDEVAYIRFASVYNKFNSLNSFIDIVNTIKQKKENN